MNYEDAISYIEGRLRFGIKPGLERMTDVMRRLGNPQDELRFVHVAGTNGKGSVCTMIWEALCASHMCAGLFTSPYVTDFRERMQINGEMISREELAEITAQVAEAVGDEQVTEFEIITCIAFVWFARRGCDIVVLETGLGGRLDSTNIIKPPLCSVITRIDLDHTAILGDTYEKIAAEKAGIIKPDSPVVVYPDQPESAMAVLADRAARLGCKLSVPDKNALCIKESSLSGTAAVYKDRPLEIGMAGAHQWLNAITAVEALRLLGIDEQYIKQGIKKARVPARLEIISQNPVVLLDGAHNPNGAAALAAFVDDYTHGRRVAVMGVCADKEYDRELSMLAPLFETIYCCDGFSPRALESERLREMAAKYTSAVACKAPKEAISAAYADVKKSGGTMVVCGSLYLAGAVRPILLKQ